MKLLVLAALLPTVADAGPRTALRAPRVREELRLVFLDADDKAPIRQGAFGDASVDVGTVRATNCAPRCTKSVVRRRFRLRVEGGATTSRFVRVQAYVQGDNPGQRVRLDGRVLSSSPQLIDANAPLRVAVAHTLEIEVSASEPQGVLAQSIQWIVEDSP